MNSLTLSARSFEPAVVRCSLPAVYVNGSRRRDLVVTRWALTGPPDFGELTVAYAAGGLATGSARLGEAQRLPPVGSTVSVVADPPHGRQCFTGAVASHRFEVDEDGERFVAVCLQRPAAEMSARLAGRLQLVGDGAVELAKAELRFNAARDSLASASAVPVGGRTCRVFDSGLSAGPWTVADALGYLLAVSVPSGVDVPDAAELDALAGNVNLGVLEATGRTVGSVIAEVLDRGGLSLRAGSDGRSLRLFRPGADGRRRSVRLQPAGQTFRENRSNLWAGTITITRRPARRGVLVLGGRKRYESTFQLAKGWDTSAETSRWRDYTRGNCDNWTATGCVYRKWVLNEHGWYSGPPWSLPLYDFSDISASDFVCASPRRFLPCLSSDNDGQSLGIVVDYRPSAEDTWRPWRGPVWVAEDQCAIYLGGDGLPADYFQPAVAGTVQVRVTCAVEADTCLSAEIQGDVGIGREVIDMSATAGWSKVHPASIFSGADGVGKPAERDDSAVLERIARRRAETGWSATDAVLTLGWVDTSYRVGDIIERVDGREFELSSNPDIRPFVRSIVHDFGTKQTTRLYVSG